MSCQFACRFARLLFSFSSCPLTLFQAERPAGPSPANRQHTVHQSEINISRFLPIILLSIMLFYVFSSSNRPAYSLQPSSEFKIERFTFGKHVPYYVNQAFDASDFGRDPSTLKAVREFAVCI